MNKYAYNENSNKIMRLALSMAIECEVNMKITMYGTEICSDCVKAKKSLTALNDIELEYKNITGDTATLKEFLAYRDSDSIFQEVKSSGRIGIPFFILENGEKTFDLGQYIDLPAEIIDTENSGSSCSIDKKGQC
jgi:glutaredoxin-related protein